MFNVRYWIFTYKADVKFVINIKNVVTYSTYEREGERGEAGIYYQGPAVRKAILGPNILYTVVFLSSNICRLYKLTLLDQALAENTQQNH